MKFIAVPVFLLLLSCSPQTSYSSFGDEITSEDATDISTMLTEVSGVKSVFKVSGVVEEVCQAKGCWMTLKNEEGKSIRVTFKDYGFFVPKDIAGRNVILEGEASMELLDEDVAKHYADDAGEEYDESMRNEITVVASGVLVQDI